jgi:hypothetical protein
MALVAGHVNVATGQGEAGGAVLKVRSRTPVLKTVASGTFSIDLSAMLVGMAGETVTIQTQKSSLQGNRLPG